MCNVFQSRVSASIFDVLLPTHVLTRVVLGYLLDDFWNIANCMYVEHAVTEAFLLGYRYVMIAIVRSKQAFQFTGTDAVHAADARTICSEDPSVGMRRSAVVLRLWNWTTTAAHIRSSLIEAGVRVRGAASHGRLTAACRCGA